MVIPAQLAAAITLALAAPARDYDGVIEVEAPHGDDVAMAPVVPPEPPTSAPAATPVATTPKPATHDGHHAHGSLPWRVGAMVDLTYLGSSALPDNHIYRGNRTTPRSNEIALGLATAYLFREADAKRWFRFALALQAGPVADAVYADEPRPGGATSRFAGDEVWKHIGQANFGVVTRKRTEVSGGIFTRPFGGDGYWARDNPHATTSWLTNARPFYLAGVRLVQALPRGFGLEAWVVNGWASAADTNVVPSFLVGLSWAHAGFEIAQRWYTGAEGEKLGLSAWRQHSATSIAYRAKRFAIAAAWDVGGERQLEMDGDPIALWTGGALSVSGRVIEGRRLDLDLATRPETWWDRAGLVFGVRQWLASATATAGLTVFDAFLVRLEYRYDHTSAAGGYFFRKDAITTDSPDLARSQHVVALMLVGWLEHTFGGGRRKWLRRGKPRHSSGTATGRATRSTIRS